ncbi:MAG: cupin domain-containing protein [Gammaproteobacteria bacterium]
MHINADFYRRIVLDTNAMPWEPSPMAGVSRRKLDRIGDEVARATSLVRYEPNSRFSEHTHGGGEEFFVLEGVFSDENGDYPAGTYVRNPIGSSHSPHSDEGCVIFVKLQQFDVDDTRQFSVSTHDATYLPGSAEGHTVLSLHTFASETCAVHKLAPKTKIFAMPRTGGQEIFVLSGAFSDAHGRYSAGTWVRNPDSMPSPWSSNDGCVLFMKTGHLPDTTF